MTYILARAGEIRRAFVLFNLKKTLEHKLRQSLWETIDCKLTPKLALPTNMVSRIRHALDPAQLWTIYN